MATETNNNNQDKNASASLVNGQKRWHPFTHANRARANRSPKHLSKDEFYETCLKFVQEQMETQQPNCISYNKSKKTAAASSENQEPSKLRCRCFATLDEMDKTTTNHMVQKGISNYMWHFYYLKKQNQQTAIMDMIRNADEIAKKECYVSSSRGTLYRVPFRIPTSQDSNDDDETDKQAWKDTAEEVAQLKVCRSTVQVILGWGRMAWGTCVKAVKTNTIPQHGLTGKEGNRVCKEVVQDMVAFFERLKMLATPKVIRQSRGSGLRIEQVHVLQLDSSWSKRQMYKRFMLERGWKVHTDAQGKCTLEPRADANWLNQNNQNQNDDENPKEPKQSIQWGTFLKFWQTEYPLLQVENARARKKENDVETLNTSLDELVKHLPNPTMTLHFCRTLRMGLNFLLEQQQQKQQQNNTTASTITIRDKRALENVFRGALTMLSIDITTATDNNDSNDDEDNDNDNNNNDDDNNNNNTSLSLLYAMGSIVEYCYSLDGGRPNYEKRINVLFTILSERLGRPAVDAS